MTARQPARFLAQTLSSGRVRCESLGLLVAEDSSEVVLHHRWLLAALLKQEARNSRLHQSVLIHIGVRADEHQHRVVQILWELVFHTHVGRQRIRESRHFAAITHRPSITPRQPPGCQKPVSP